MSLERKFLNKVFSYGFILIIILGVLWSKEALGSPIRAMWVWDTSNIIYNIGTAKPDLFNFCSAPHSDSTKRITTIYLYARAHIINNKVNLRNFLSEAHSKGLKVDYLDGDPSWATSSGGLNGEQTCDDVLNFNKGGSSNQRFDGIHFDVEPYGLTDWNTNKQAIWEEYLTLLTNCKAKIASYNASYSPSIQFSVDIPRAYDSDGDPITNHGQVQARVDYTTIMDYVDTYGSIKNDATNEIQTGPCFIGVETGDLAPYSDGNPETTTFYQEGWKIMEGELDKVSAYFVSNYPSNFLGIAIHHYNSYRELRGPTVSSARNNPQTQCISCNLGDSRTFTVRGRSLSNNLRGTEWYLNRTHQISHFDMTGLDDTDSWSYTFDSSGVYEVATNVFDIAGIYCEIPATWKVYVQICEFAGGSGTEADPFQISSGCHWQCFMNNPSYWDKHFVLMSDIDLLGVELSPIGTFIGVFDGKDHTIHNVVINRPDIDYVGLFSIVETGGQIRHLRVANVTITGRQFVGGLVGWNKGPLTACYAGGSVTGSGHCAGGLVGWNGGNLIACSTNSSVKGFATSVGGLVGQSLGSLVDCSAGIGSVSGGMAVGGLAGTSYQSSVANCHAVCPVTGDNGVGGLVGWNCRSSITSSYSTAPVNGGLNVGGLVAYNEGIVNGCYATGLVTADSNFVGGLAGYNKLGGTITDCYTTGAVQGYQYVGGLLGANVGNMTTCYSTSAVSGTLDFAGLIGLNEGTVTACFWSVGTSGLHIGVASGTPAGQGRTTPEMKTSSTFTSSGWDFVGETANGTEDTWSICEGTNYPKFLWQIPPIGDFNCPDGVDFVDFARLSLAWQSDPSQYNWNGICDISDPHDSIIDERDLAVLAEHWLEGTTP